MQVELATPVSLPPHISKHDKDVDSLYGAVIYELEVMRNHHRDKLMAVASSHSRYVALEQKLIRGEQLDERGYWRCHQQTYR